MRLTNVKFYCLFAHMWTQHDKSKVGNAHNHTAQARFPNAPWIRYIYLSQVLVNLEKTSEKVLTWVKGKAIF